MKIRVKLGPNIYGQDFICASCRGSFRGGGTFLRLEHAGNVVDIPVCGLCWNRGALLEGMVDLSQHCASHRMGLA